MILRRCAAAVRPGGHVLVFQGLLDRVEDLGSMTGFDLFMLVCCGGRQRTLREFEALGARAGLRDNPPMYQGAAAAASLSPCR